MLRTFKRRYAPSGPRAPTDGPRPEATCYIVGDIHGRADLLDAMLGLIDAHIGGTTPDDPQLVFLGDYIDHGPDSAAVLDRLQALKRDFPNNVTCLMGNHERMLLDFLDDPAVRGPRWMRNGGGPAVESILPTARAPDAADPAEHFITLSADIRDGLGRDTLAWLRDLPLTWSSGNLWVTHAGADPLRPMQDQSARVLLWGHPEFETAERGDGVWVAYGHIERDRPGIAEGRIALDTGAWHNGRLTTIAVAPDGAYTFLQT